MNPAPVSRSRRRRLKVLVGAAGVIASVLATAGPVNAYTTTGCNWGDQTLTIDIRYVNGNYRTAITNAKTNYNNATDLTLTLTDSAGPAFTAKNTNYGATGWEGYTNWSCFLQTTTAADAKLNDYYLTTGAPVNRTKVVWLHELGHGLGLNHVSGLHHVMYTSASSAYFDGVLSLTSDEITGINTLY